MAERTPAAEPATSDAAPEFGPHYFRHSCGVPYERNEHWLEFFGEIADGIVRTLEPSSVLDAGCAMGFLVEALRQRGVEAWGIDVSEYAISRVDESVADRCSVASLAEPLDRRYDLIVCIEVLEHIPPAETDKVIANLCGATDRLLLSSTPDDFGEASHLNVRPQEEWSAALAREGFLRDVDQDVSFLTPWAALYVRREEPLAETVRRYDRSWWRHRREAAELRASLLSAEERLAELEGSADSESLREDLERSQEEILRLRDLLVGKDAELGAALGKVTALEEQMQRIANAAQLVQSKFPGMTLLSGLLRKLRGLRRA
jgi:SAM-dependent methyltransferase